MATSNSTKQSTRSGNITQFEIFEAKDGGKSIDASDAVVDIRYYEDVLSNTVSLSVIIAETGESDDDEFGNKGMIDGLPLRGGNPAHIMFEDHEGNELKFKNDNKLYLNRVRNVIPGTQKDVYTLDFSSREFFTNEQCRVVKKYTGKISDTINSILTESTWGSGGIKTQKELHIDETALEYNFVGNERKPFYICTWLASKSVPANIKTDKQNHIGGTAGYFFYETYDGFNFKSIDALVDPEKNEPKGKYIFTNSADNPPGYDGKILNYDIDRDIDLQNNLSIGTYANRTIFFDFMKYEYKVRNFRVDEAEGEESTDSSKGKITTAGKDGLDSVAPEFRQPVSRLMSRILDIGIQPSGDTAEKQLEHWKDSMEKPNFDAADIMVQSVMRYNQMFLIKINIMIAGDFTLRAGDLIYCEFPELSTESNKTSNKQSGGIYMISSLCHRITTEETYTSLTLVRDTFGRRSF